jgi:tetratricopeptide (TPR) repeat protein
VASPAQDSDEYIAVGEEAFRAGRYEDALRAWQHAMVDNPNHGGLVLMMAQALFALGRHEDAAGAVQMAMQMLPEGEWGAVAKNYSQLYGNVADYSNQLKALEKARTAKPDDPALRFLLGYHFGYLGYPKQAVQELDKALDLQPKDLGSQKLRDMFAVQAGVPVRPSAAGTEGTNIRPQVPPQPQPAPQAAPEGPS